MKEDKTAVRSSAGKENEPAMENQVKKKAKEEKPPTKVVVRRLPPSMTEEQFKMQVSPMPEFDYFYFVVADMSLTPNAFSRAYINFVDQSDLLIFTQKFDGYVFVDSKGGEFPAVVEFAQFQRIPKNRPNRKKDSKVGTIEADPMYIAFKEQMEAKNCESKTSVNTSKQHFFETSLAPEKKEELNNTPLLDYVRNKRAERQRIREEKREEKRKKDLERRKAKEEQRRVRKEDETSVVKVLNNSQSSNKERLKEKEVKPSFVKRKSDEVKTSKEKVSTEIRAKESKRAGKSYLEERQRQAERREERKKLSLGVDSKSTTTPDEGATTPANCDKPTEELPLSESKAKETEHKKAERVFKREERRSSYKYDKFENKRDRDDDSRRSRRASERTYQSSRKDDDRMEDGGRKRYSESRRSHDSSQRDRYKEKEKNKAYNQKKSEALTELDESKLHIPVAESSDKPIAIQENLENNDAKDCTIADENKGADKLDSTSYSKENTSEVQSEKVGLGAKPKFFESTKPMRRKSVDYEKTRHSSSYNKSYSKEKQTEKKRRNSMGSSKHIAEGLVNNSLKNDKEEVVNVTNMLVEKLTEETKSQADSQTRSSNIEEETPKKFREDFDDINREMPKRRNSTGERKESEKTSPRRNSLGSVDKHDVSKIKENEDDRKATFEEDKCKPKKKAQANSWDPRTERRIRNKDRPSLEIYRPGMGKFSKQRLEREKERGLGSSTEVDSPSPSPSPTPQLRHKSTTPH